MLVPQFKKRLLVETGIFSAIIVVLAGVTYLLSTISDDYTESNDAAKKKIDLIDLELNKIQTRYSYINKNEALYKEVQQKLSDGKLSIKRQTAFEKFNLFRTQYALSNLRLTVSPVQEMKDAKYKRPTSTVSSSEVGVEMDVLYDENVYQLIKAIETELPGVCVISKFNISLQKPLTSDVLQTIGIKGTFPLIKAAFHFNWYSINPVEIADPNADAAKK